MQPKIIFFDIDDTLSRNGIIAEHNKSTLQQLAKTDIKVVIATGRAKIMIPTDIMDLYEQGVIDAIICMNGQYTFNKTPIKSDKEHSDKEDKSNAIISHYPLTNKQAQMTIELCKDEAVVYKFESATAMGWSEEHPELKKLLTSQYEYIVDPEMYKTQAVYQCSVFFANDEDRLEHIDFGKYDLKLVHWHEIGADILPINASKARAIKDVCQYYAVSPTDCMAFGDGYNDLEMFELVGYPVAMGDGAENLKQCAIEHGGVVTGSIENRGIQAVLEGFDILPKH